jgi:uncharacterized protein (DUF924 family)
MSTKTSKDVLDFWFDEKMKPYWYKKDSEVDGKIRAQFIDLWQMGLERRLEVSAGFTIMSFTPTAMVV